MQVFMTYHGKGLGREGEPFYLPDAPAVRFGSGGEEIEITPETLAAYGLSGTPEEFAKAAVARFNANRDPAWLSYRTVDDAATGQSGAENAGQPDGSTAATGDPAQTDPPAAPDPLPADSAIAPAAGDQPTNDVTEGGTPDGN